MPTKKPEQKKPKAIVPRVKPKAEPPKKKALGSIADSATKKEIIERRRQQLDKIEALIKENMADVKNPAAKERYRARLAKVQDLRAELDAKPKEDLSGCQHVHVAHLADAGGFKPWRKLTPQEQRVDFAKLASIFDDAQGSLSDEMTSILSDEVDRVTSSIEKKLDAGDIAGIAAVAFLLRGKLRDNIKKTIVDGYEAGKSMAAKELGIARPGTPTDDVKILSAMADITSEGVVSKLEQVARTNAIEAYAVGAGTKANVAAMNAELNKAAARAILDVSGTVVGEGLNLGRYTVFFDNITKIVSFQRSEVLDSKTCEMCLSIDGRVVKADDPFANMHTVHTNCRGLWVPVFASDDEIPDITGIPKAISDRFDKVDGRPMVNAFKQPKRAVNSVSDAARAEIEKRLKASKKTK